MANICDIEVYGHVGFFDVEAAFDPVFDFSALVGAAVCIAESDGYWQSNCWDVVSLDESLVDDDCIGS